MCQSLNCALEIKLWTKRPVSTLTLVGSHAAEKAAKSECGRISKATDVILCSAFWMCNQLSHQTPNQSMDVGTDPVMFFSLE